MPSKETSRVETIKGAAEVCDSESIRGALARLLNVSPEKFASLSINNDEMASRDLLSAVRALAGETVDLDRLSEDQKLMISQARQLSEQEILYLLECAAETIAGPDHSPG